MTSATPVCRTAWEYVCLKSGRISLVHHKKSVGHDFYRVSVWGRQEHASTVGLHGWYDKEGEAVNILDDRVISQ